MKLSFDPAKNIKNLCQRGLSFNLVGQFDFKSAKIWEDTRKPYPEVRFVAIGYLDKRLHVVIFSPTDEGIRVISLRKANVREGEKHDFKITLD